MADALSRKSPAPRLNAGDRANPNKTLFSNSTPRRAEQIETLQSVAYGRIGVTYDYRDPAAQANGSPHGLSRSFNLRECDLHELVPSLAQWRGGDDRFQQN
jgi:hypothetical protein